MNHRTAWMTGALFAGLGVALGAFGAHGLKPLLLANQRVDVYETAIKYMIYHSFALLIAGVIMKQLGTDARLSLAAWSWILGIVFFSGSLLAICFVPIGMFALLTPLGGFFFLMGWGLLVAGVSKKMQ